MWCQKRAKKSSYAFLRSSKRHRQPRVGDPARPQPDLAFLGELAGIAEEIEQDLPQPHGVDGQCAEVLLGVDDEAVLVLLGKLSGGADDVVDQRCELHGLWVELELSRLDLRQVEHLVDEAEKVSTRAVHALQGPLRLFCAEARRVFDQHVGEPDDGIERRAQLMAHAGDELRLVLARHLQLAALASISRNRRAFWIANTDWAANVNVCRR